jgi:hypothetical protein
LGDHIRSRRLDLNLQQIGVDVTTICAWENNASAPAIRYIPSILSFLGYDPFPSRQTLPERLATARKVLGRLALSLGLDPGTLQSWEAGRHEPTRRSVELIERFLKTLGNPDTVLQEVR